MKGKEVGEKGGTEKDRKDRKWGGERDGETGLGENTSCLFRSMALPYFKKSNRGK